jgi:hypothetical protein
MEALSGYLPNLETTRFLRNNPNLCVCSWYMYLFQVLDYMVRATCYSLQTDYTYTWGIFASLRFSNSGTGHLVTFDEMESFLTDSREKIRNFN